MKLFLALLAVTWVCAILIWIFFRKTDALYPAISWMPSATFARSIILRVDFPASTFWLLTAVIFAGVGIWREGALSAPLFLPALLVLGPVPLSLLCQAERIVEKKSREYVLINPFKPLAAVPGEERVTAFYIRPSDWTSLKTATPEDREYWRQFQVAPSLYLCPCDNHHLHEIDSLGLERFLIHPDNKEAMETITRALSGLGTQAEADELNRTSLETLTEFDLDQLYTLFGAKATQPEEEENDSPAPRQDEPPDLLASALVPAEEPTSKASKKNEEPAPSLVEDRPSDSAVTENE